MDGVIVVDKPSGLTSHDVVASVRRLLGEPRIGHTGTLDPLATGVLPLALGKATRLARFLSAADKEYDATIRFGVTTDSYDITGTETGRTGVVPSREAIERAVDRLRGDYLQMPPAFSAKKVGGQRAYTLARREQAVALEPAPVRVTRAEVGDVTGPLARIAITCSAGFYVRTFAHSLGELTGAGACLEALRRTRSGDFGLDQAVGLAALQDEAAAHRALIPLGRLLPAFPAVTATSRGLGYVSHGRELGPDDYEAIEGPASRNPPWVRILDANGVLLALGTSGSAPGSLHPSVVLM